MAIVPTKLKAASEDHRCRNELCKAPMNETCDCPECMTLTTEQRRHRVYCHACETMYRVVMKSPHLAHEHEKWKRERDERRKNMGL